MRSPSFFGVVLVTSLALQACNESNGVATEPVESQAHSRRSVTASTVATPATSRAQDIEEWIAAYRARPLTRLEGWSLAHSDLSRQVGVPKPTGKLIRAARENVVRYVRDHPDAIAALRAADATVAGPDPVATGINCGFGFSSLVREMPNWPAISQCAYGSAYFAYHYGRDSYEWWREFLEDQGRFGWTWAGFMQRQFCSAYLCQGEHSDVDWADAG